MIKLKTPMDTFSSHTGVAKATSATTVQNEKGFTLHTLNHQFMESITGKVILQGGFYYFVNDLELAEMAREAEKAEGERQQRIQAETARREAEIASYQAELKAFQESYDLPFKHSTRIKIVLSGLSANSNGCGSKKNTVFHLFVKEAFQDGRVKREADTYLCSPNDSGKFSTLDDYEHNDKIITCKKCLSIMERWKR